MAITTTDKSLAALKEEICDIGRRIYNKGFAAGNDGNISARLSHWLPGTPSVQVRANWLPSARGEKRHSRFNPNRSRSMRISPP